MRGAIFDVDGTLLDSMEMWDHAGERYLAGRGIAASPELGKILFPMTMSQAAEYMKAQFYLAESVGEIVEGVNRTIDHFYRYEVQPKPGAADFLAKLEARGFLMTIATSSDHPLIEAALRRLDMFRYFKRIFTCSEMGTGKERPEIYMAALAFMGTEKSETWVFEDAVHAAKTAKAAGFRLAGVRDSSSESRQQELRELSDCYLTDFCDFNVFPIGKS